MPRLRNVGSVQALCDRGLFRATSALQILGGLGEVFAEGLTGIIGAAEASSEVDATLRDGAFSGTEPVNRVEVFISHTWSSGRWPKYLSMCYFLNLGIAVKSALVCWVLAVASLCIVQAYMSGICDRYYLFPLLIELPVLAFFVFFFFGQHLTGGCFAPSFWLDKLCIHQTKHDLKAQQVAALPVFVARSTRMLVLWDDTYFERLWCNMEMATFAKYSASPEKMEFLPLWLAPWMLSSVLLDLLGVTLVCCMQRSASGEGYEDSIDAIAKHGAELVGGSQNVRTFIHMFLEVFPSFTCYLPVALPTLLSFKRKIQGHELMLEQMASFDLKNAKCSVEEDRPLVEEQVALHFKPEIDHEVIVAGADGAAAPVEAEDSHEEALERFNNYVQGPLRAACLDSIGDLQEVPLHLCYICFLPMSFYAAVNVTPFAYGDCTMSYSTMGFDSPNHLMLTFATCWLCTQLLVFPVTFPLLLRTLQLIESTCSNTVLRLLLGSLGSAFAYAYTFFCAGTIWGVTTVVSQSYSPTWLLIYLIVVACLAFQAYVFFGKRPKPSCSCRCLEPTGGDDSKPMLAFRV